VGQYRMPPDVASILQDYEQRLSRLEVAVNVRANAVQTDPTPGETTHTVTSTSYIDVTSYPALTMQTYGGDVLLIQRVRIGAVSTGVGALTFGIYGGADVASDGLVVVPTGSVEYVVSWLAVGLAAGSHTFKLRARVTAGSMDIIGAIRERMIAVEFR